MTERYNFRTLKETNLGQVYTSLGLPVTAFHDSNKTTKRPFFNTVLNSDDSRPNGLWMFKGSEYFFYNLETGEIEDGPRSIAGNFAGDTLPTLFRTGIDSAVWGGPAFPNYWFLFKDQMFVRINSNVSSNVNGTSEDPSFVKEKLWQVDYGWRGILGEWATGVWTNPDGTWRTDGVPVALHGLGSKYYGTIHFFKDGEYICHDLKTGKVFAGPMPIKDAWKLPDEFSNRIDLAFYGSGPNEENIYFISGEKYVLYDFRRNEVIDSGAVEKRFPAFAKFIGRPQLFLVEDYTLKTLVGPAHIGRLIDTRNIGAGSEFTKIFVTETHDMTKTNLTQSLLESDDTSVMSDFHDKMDKNTSTSENSESYKYQLNSKLHAEAEANSLWGGEVNASLNVAGGTDTLRAALSNSVFKSIQSQVTNTKKSTTQTTYNSEDEITKEVNVLKKEIFKETNSSDKARIYEFYEQLQPYITLLVLQHVRVGYMNGTHLKVVELPELLNLLNEVIIEIDQQKQLMTYIQNELTSVTDYQGNPRSIIASSSSSNLMIDKNLSSTYQIQHTDGTVQDISAKGLIKASKSWIEPTFTITCVQIEQDTREIKTDLKPRELKDTKVQCTVVGEILLDEKKLLLVEVISHKNSQKSPTEFFIDYVKKDVDLFKR
ncbi:hypothetical protein G9298_28195 (plasmid) [Bacillus thuringiensis]|nr:hypothetical protein G9298_28195 [Bacillus thuringiensis]